MLLFLLVALGALSAYVYLTRPERLAQLAEVLLAETIGGEVSVESARFDLDGTIHLGRVEIRVPDVPPEAAVLFDANQVMLKHDLLSLAGGKFHPRSLTFINPTLHRTEVISDGKFNHQFLQEDPGRRREFEPPDMLPEVFIRGGRLAFGEVDIDGTYRHLGDMQLEGTLTETTSQTATYLFNLRQQRRSGEPGPTLSGTFDLQNLRISGKLERFFVDSPQRNILPNRLRSWWDELRPEGKFPTVTFGYDPDPTIGFHAVLELEDIKLSLPYLEAPSRMTVGSGRFTVANETVSITDLAGQIEDFGYVINGEIRGFSTDAPFTLEARIIGDVPDNPHYLPGLPVPVQETFRRFTPAGRFTSLVVLSRAIHGGDFSYDGRVQIQNARLTDAYFPYPLSNVRGEFRFDDDKVQIVSIQGDGPTGGRAVVRGVIAPPGDEAQIDISVTGLGIPVDAALMRALEPHQRPLIRAMMDRDLYALLSDPRSGLVKSTEQHQQWNERISQLQLRRAQLENATPGDPSALAQVVAEIEKLRQQLKRPLFDIGGSITTHTTMHRPVGANQPYTISTEIDLAGMGLLLSDWAYPIRLTAGTMKIEEHQLTLNGVHGEGLHGGTGEITGGHFPDRTPQEQWSPRVHFDMRELPVDDLLLASMPVTQAHWIEQLRLEGKLYAAGEIYRRDDGEIDFLVRANLVDGRARPFAGGYDIDDLTAKLTLRYGQIDIDQARGTHGDSILKLSGKFIPEGENATYRLSFSGENLNLADPVLDMVPSDTDVLKRLRQLFKAHEPTGRFAADLSAWRDVGGESDFRIDLHPGDVGLTVQNTLIELTHVDCSVTFTPAGLNINDLTANYGEGSLSIAGSITAEIVPTVDVHFAASNRELCDMTRAMLPPDVTQIIDEIELTGGYAIEQAHLRLSPGEGNTRELDFTCDARLTDAACTLGLPITQLDGTLAIKAKHNAADNDGMAHVDLDFNGPSLRFAGRLVRNLTFHAETDHQEKLLQVTDLIGHGCGGTVVGRGRMALHGDHRYQLEVALQNAQLEPLLEPEKYPNGVMDDPTAAISAQLSIMGVPGDPTKRYGRGRYDVRNGQFYHVPVAMAVLHMVNLSLPGSTSFDRAYADFLIDGNDINFETIRFEAPSLEIAGAGVMKYDTKALDLELTMRNPRGSQLGVVSDMLNVFKDELMHIHVGGTLSEPKAKLKTFQGIQRGWQGLFGGVGHQLNRINPLSRQTTDELVSVPDGADKTSDQ
jgi:hypothetical protein